MIKLILIILVALIFLNAEKVFSSEYNRKDWPHWSKSGDGCLNTRAKTLKDQSLDKVTYKGKKGCTVASGKWNDFYYNEVLLKAGDIDIDHVIPLKKAHTLGGYKWTKEKRKQFANDPLNLVVTNKKYNRQKGAKDLSEWLPVDRQYACRYAKRWTAVANKYDFKISDNEKRTIELLKCN